MSQEKVNAYKEDKANRKSKYAAQQKKKNAGKWAAKIVFGLFALAIIVALVVTGVNIIKDYNDSKPNYDAEEFVLDDYMNVSVKNEITADDLVNGNGKVTIGENGETIITGNDEDAAAIEEAPANTAETTTATTKAQ